MKKWLFNLLFWVLLAPSFALAAEGVDVTETSSCFRLLVENHEMVTVSPDVDVEAFMVEYRSLGATSADEEHAVRSGLKLAPLLERGLLYRAVAEVLHQNGYADPKQDKLEFALMGFKLLNQAERIQFVNSVFEKIQLLVGNGLTLSTLKNLETIAKSLGMTPEAYIRFCSEAKPILSAEPDALKFAIFLKLNASQAGFIQEVKSQYQNRQYFNRGTALALSHENADVTLHYGERVKINLSVVVKRRAFFWDRTEIQEFHVRKDLIEFSKTSCFWRLIEQGAVDEDCFKSYMASLNKGAILFDDLKFLLDQMNRGETETEISKKYTTQKHRTTLYKHVLLPYFISLMSAPLTHNQVLNLLNEYFGYITTGFLFIPGIPDLDSGHKTEFLMWIRNHYKDDPFYANLIVN